MSYLLALDAGTGSIRVIIFDLNGRQPAVGQVEQKHLSVDNVLGSVEFDLTTDWQLACQYIRQALNAAGLSVTDVQSIVCCSMCEGIILYDYDGKVTWTCANVDARANHEVAELKEIHDYRFEFEVYEISGQALALSTMLRLLWLAHRRPDIYHKAAITTMTSDWLAVKLSGELTVDPSNAGTTGMPDLSSRNWRPALLDMAGLRADMLLPVKETDTLLGAVIEAVAHESGLRAGMPVAMGGGDVQLGCLGLGAVRAGQTAVPGGIFWQQVVNLPQVHTDPQMNIRVNPRVIPGMAQTELISLFTGSTMRQFRDVLCAEGKLIAERFGVDAYSPLEEMASRVPAGSHGVMPIPPDAMHLKQWYHATPSSINLSIGPEKCNRAILFRVLEENTAIIPACNLAQIPQFSGVTLESLVFAGGGSKGALWSQILSDVTGLPVRVSVAREATALSCAIAAGTGAGLYGDMTSIGERLVSRHRELTLNPQYHGLYQGMISKWQVVYADQLGLVDNGLTTSMWQAPGLECRQCVASFPSP